jgi:hypothetical protein
MAKFTARRDRLAHGKEVLAAHCLAGGCGTPRRTAGVLIVFRAVGTNAARRLTVDFRPAEKIPPDHAFITVARAAR